MSDLPATYDAWRLADERPRYFRRRRTPDADAFADRVARGAGVERDGAATKAPQGDDEDDDSNLGKE